MVLEESPPPVPQIAVGEDAFRALWMERVHRLMPIPTLILMGTAAVLGERPWACLASGVVFAAGNLLIDRLAEHKEGVARQGVARHLAVALPILTMTWVSGPDNPGWLLGIVPCFLGALAPSRRDRSISSTVFISAPILGAVLAGSSDAHVLLIMVLMSCIAVLSTGLFEIMHSVWQEAERRREELEVSAEDLRQAVRTREIFLANMTHELRTPLNGVLGATELLLGGELEPEQRELTEMARKSGRGLLRILDAILDTTRLASEGLTLQRLPYNPRAMSTELCELQRAALTRPLSINLSTHGLPEKVMGDPARVRQVLFNLIGNAAKFTAEGQVSVDLEWKAGMLHVSVQDTGEGIPPEALLTLSEAFNQADNSSTRRHGGLGLGLHLCYKVIGQMGGKLQVESKLGSGSRFFFEIPAPEAPKA